MQIKHLKYKYLIIFFLLIFNLNGFSQTSITFKAENQPLNAVLSNISSTYKVRFAYDDDYLSKIKATFSVKNLGVESFLKFLSVKYPIGYKQIGSTWTIFKIAEPKPVIPKWTVKKVEPEPVLKIEPVIPKPKIYSFFGNVYDATTGNRLKYSDVLIGNSNLVPGDRSAHFYTKILSFGSIDVKLKRQGYAKIDTIIQLNDSNAVFLYLKPETDFLKLVSGNMFRFDTRTTSSDDNLTLIDGIELPHINYFSGYINPLNSAYVHNSYSKNGGYDITYNNGSNGLNDYSANIHARKSAFSFEASLTDVNVATGIPFSDKVSMSVAARKSITEFWPNYYFMNIANSQKITSASGKESWNVYNPSSSFYDVNANLSWRPDSLNDIIISFITGYDNSKRNYDLKFTRNYDLNFYDMNRFYGYGLKWNFIPSKTTSHNLAAMFTTNNLHSEVNAGVTIPEREQFLSSQSEKNFSQSNVLALSWITRISGLKLSHEFGGEYRMNILNYDYSFNQADANGNSVINIDSLVINANKHIAQVFYEAVYYPFARLSITAGVKGLYDISSGNLLFIPRLSVNASPVDDLHLYLNFGRYVQHLYKAEKFGTSFNTDYVWFMNQGTKNFIDSYHNILGADYSLGGFKTSLEGYFKTESGRAVLFPDKVSDGVYKYSIVQGDAVRMGVDFNLQFKHSIFSHNLKYSFSSSKEKVAGKNSNHYFSSLNNRPHRLKFSEIISLYGFNAKIDYEFASGNPYFNYTSQNYRFDFSTSPVFSQLDVEIGKQFKIGKCNSEISVNILNVLNTKNETDRFNHIIWENSNNENVVRIIEGMPFTVGGRIALKW